MMMAILCWIDMLMLFSFLLRGELILEGFTGAYIYPKSYLVNPLSDELKL